MRTRKQVLSSLCILYIFIFASLLYGYSYVYLLRFCWVYLNFLFYVTFILSIKLIHTIFLLFFFPCCTFFYLFFCVNSSDDYQPGWITDKFRFFISPSKKRTVIKLFFIIDFTCTNFLLCRSFFLIFFIFLFSLDLTRHKKNMKNYF